MTDTMQTPAKPRALKRARTWRPNFDKKAPKVWDPEKARTVASYPKTAEAYERMREANRARIIAANQAGKMGRRDIPDGWSGRRDELAAVREKARQEAEAIMAVLRARGEFEGDDERAELALGFVMQVSRDPTVRPKLRLTATRLVLEFTMPRPKGRVVVDPDAEAWLGALEADAGLPRSSPIR